METKEDHCEVPAETSRPRSYNWLRLLMREYRWRFFASFVFATLVFSLLTESRILGYFLVFLTFSVIYFISRFFWLSVVTSSLVSFLSILAIYGASKFKFWLVGRRLHPHDLYLYLNLDNLIYTKTLYPNHFTLLVGGIAGCALIVLVFGWIEGFKRPTRRVFVGFGVVILASAGIVQVGRYMELGAFGGGNGFMHFDHQHVSTFTLSSIYALPELIDGRSFDYGEARQIDSVTIEQMKAVACIPSRVAPDIFLLMRESAMVPSTLAEMGYPNLGPALFKSSNGRSYRLKVETHGAGSAHSIFSALTGLSAASFGSMMNIGIDLSINKISMSVPQMLEKCGYTTIAITTGMSGYVLDREFYDSIGFDQYYDMGDVMHFYNNDTSDKSVYSFTRDILLQAKKDKPLFVYIDTTAAHGPYDTKLRPEEEVLEANGRNAEANEYIRRLILGERDFQGFLSYLREYSGEVGKKILVTDFGDHQPSLTKYLPGQSGTVNLDRMQDDELLFTFFRLQSIGFQLPVLPDHTLVDVPFLGDWMIRASKVKAAGAYSQRWGIVEECVSRYWRCNGGEEAYRLHQALRSAKLISIP